MKSNRSKILLIIAVSLIVSLLFGISYAFYIFNTTQVGLNGIQSDCFKIEFSDENDIYLDKSYPISESEALDLVPYSFTLKNVCNHVAKYDVNMEILDGTTIDLNSVMVKLDDMKSNKVGELPNSANIVNNNAVSSKTIKTDYLQPNAEVSYNLRLFISEDSTIDQSANKHFESKVVIVNELVSDYTEATLVNGKTFGNTLKTLAGTELTNSTYTKDYNIKSIVFSDVAPDESTIFVNIALENSQVPVYAWFDEDTIYLYTVANKIYCNEDSSMMFQYMTNLENFDITRFDTSRVTSMVSFFEGAGFKTLDLSKFDTSNVTSMYLMFSYSSFEELDLSNFDTSKVTSMSKMFYVANGLKTLDLSSFNTSNVTNMMWMFDHMNNLESVNLSSFDTSKVTSMVRMFNKDPKLKEVDLSSFETNQVSIDGMFVEDKNLKTIYVSDKWNPDNTTSSGNIFLGNSLLVGGQGTTYNLSNLGIDYAHVDGGPSNPGYFTLKAN